MLLKALVENTVEENCDLDSQHGISLYIEALGKKLLFDTGQNDLFSKNAEKMNVNLADIDYLFISHAHYDHAGGIKYFLEKNRKGKIILSHNSLGDYYAKPLPFIYKYIGIDKELFQKNKDRFMTIEDNEELIDNIFILHNTEFAEHRPIGNKKLYRKVEGKYELDAFNHEIIMAIKENEEWILFTGCSHSGIVNMLNSFRKKFPNHKIKALIGGFHFMNLVTKDIAESQETIKQVADKISTFNIDKIYTGHCTGEEAYNLLSFHLGETMDTFKTGKEIKI